jgi:hypothetical protein
MKITFKVLVTIAIVALMVVSLCLMMIEPSMSAAFYAPAKKFWIMAAVSVVSKFAGAFLFFLTWPMFRKTWVGGTFRENVEAIMPPKA